MAKTKKTAKKPYDDIFRLLDALQRRLDKVSQNGALALDAAATSGERERQTRQYLRDLFTKVSVLENVDQSQGKINKEVTDSLYKLRESTGKAFDGVSGDMKSMLQTVQRLNERIGKVESQDLVLANSFSIVNGFDVRLKALESYKQFLQAAFKGE